MSQIQAKSLTTIRGRAYRCLHCPSSNAAIGEKRRVEAHIYKLRIPLEQSPFYCKLCMFRCTEQDDLERHVLSFKLHKERAALQGDHFDVEEWLIQSANPYYITAKDMTCLSIEESERVWQQRKKVVTGLSSPTNSIPTPAPLRSPPAIQRQLGTPVQDENVWEAIMGSNQYSTGMTITPPPSGLQMPVSSHPTTSSCQNTSPQIFPRPVLASASLSTYNPPTLPPSFGTTVDALPAINTILPALPQIATSSTFSSPVLNNIYTPSYPAYGHTSYVPTTIMKSPEKREVEKKSQGCQTDGSLSIDKLTNAVYDLNKAIHSGLGSIAKAVENQTFLIGAINTQLKNYVRNAEDEAKKRKREDETKEKDKSKDNKKSKH